jgi:hypothetical protein
MAGVRSSSAGKKTTVIGRRKKAAGATPLKAKKKAMAIKKKSTTAAGGRKNTGGGMKAIGKWQDGTGVRKISRLRSMFEDVISRFIVQENYLTLAKFAHELNEAVMGAHARMRGKNFNARVKRQEAKEKGEKTTRTRPKIHPLLATGFVFGHGVSALKSMVQFIDACSNEDWGKEYMKLDKGTIKGWLKELEEEPKDVDLTVFSASSAPGDDCEESFNCRNEVVKTVYEKFRDVRIKLHNEFIYPKRESIEDTIHHLLQAKLDKATDNVFDETTKKITITRVELLRTWHRDIKKVGNWVYQADHDNHAKTTPCKRIGTEPDVQLADPSPARDEAGKRVRDPNLGCFPLRDQHNYTVQFRIENATQSFNLDRLSLGVRVTYTLVESRGNGATVKFPNKTMDIYGNFLDVSTLRQADSVYRDKSAILKYAVNAKPWAPIKSSLNPGARSFQPGKRWSPFMPFPHIAYLSAAARKQHISIEDDKAKMVKELNDNASKLSELEKNQLNDTIFYFNQKLAKIAKREEMINDIRRHVQPSMFSHAAKHVPQDILDAIVGETDRDDGRKRMEEARTDNGEFSGGGDGDQLVDPKDGVWPKTAEEANEMLTDAIPWLWENGKRTKAWFAFRDAGLRMLGEARAARKEEVRQASSSGSLDGEMDIWDQGPSKVDAKKDQGPSKVPAKKDAQRSRDQDLRAIPVAVGSQQAWSAPPSQRTARPSSARPSSARPSSARPSSARPSSARPSSAKRESSSFASAHGDQGWLNESDIVLDVSDSAASAKRGSFGSATSDDGIETIMLPEGEPARTSSQAPKRRSAWGAKPAQSQSPSEAQQAPPPAQKLNYAQAEQESWAVHSTFNGANRTAKVDGSLQVQDLEDDTPWQSTRRVAEAAGGGGSRRTGKASASRSGRAARSSSRGKSRSRSRSRAATKPAKKKKAVAGQKNKSVAARKKK